jgi:two-component system, response regulator PdtaR
MIKAVSIAPPLDWPVFLRQNSGAKFSPEGSPAGSTRLARPARVLVVEDDYFVSLEIDTTLTEMGCDVIGIAATGEDAIKLAERGRPELVLMDVRLAGRLDGVDAAAVIYRRFGIRSLFVTAHSDPQTRARGENANPLGWASKPFTFHQLTTAVRTALDELGSKQ